MNIQFYCFFTKIFAPCASTFGHSPDPNSPSKKVDPDLGSAFCNKVDPDPDTLYLKLQIKEKI